MPELHNLRVFVAVAEELSFTRAAETLHLAQQTVSNSVRDLERELGVTLLERTTREVRITPAGFALLQDAREVVRRADAAFAKATSVGTGRSGTVSVGVTPAIGPIDRSEAARALRRDQPELSVAFRDLRPGEVRHSLRNHTVDFVLARSKPNEDATVQHADLRATAMDLCLPVGHRLANRRSLKVADLHGERLLCASPPGTPYTDMVLSLLKQGGATVQPIEARVTGGSPPEPVKSDETAGRRV